jgi:hypothetical protein
MRMRSVFPVTVIFFPVFACAAPPATAPTAAPNTQPNDPTMDWLLNQSSTAPSTQSADAATQPAATTQPAMPLQSNIEQDQRDGVLTMSDGEKLVGSISTTLDQPMRFWVDAEQKYHDIPFDLIASMEAQVLWERDEKEWKFVENGSDIKEYSGKTYPAHELVYEVTLLNGDKLTGGIAAPLYVRLADGSTKLEVLHKRAKGEVGQTLKDLLYVQSVHFNDAGK